MDSAQLNKAAKLGNDRLLPPRRWKGRREQYLGGESGGWAATMRPMGDLGAMTAAAERDRSQPSPCAPEPPLATAKPWLSRSHTHAEQTAGLGPFFCSRLCPALSCRLGCQLRPAPTGSFRLLAIVSLIQYLPLPSLLHLLSLQL